MPDKRVIQITGIGQGRQQTIMEKQLKQSKVKTHRGKAKLGNIGKHGNNGGSRGGSPSRGAHGHSS